MDPIERIVQIQTAQPVGELSRHAKSPILFGLSEAGRVYWWNWAEKKWETLEDWRERNP